MPRRTPTRSLKKPRYLQSAALSALFLRAILI
jgi:hypothetical protein